VNKTGIEKYVDSIENTKNLLYGKLENSGGFTDCFKKYKFIREFDTLDFNQRMNNLNVTHLVINEKYDYTKMFNRDIINPIKFGANTIFGILGMTGTGKSELAQTIILISKLANKDIKNRDVLPYICWTMGDLYATLPKINKGDIVWKDESPRSTGKGSRTEKWRVDNVLAVIRKYENTFIFIDPLEIRIDLCNIYFESAGMDFKNRSNRFMILNKERKYLGHIYTKLHNDEEFRQWYEQEKDKFIKDILHESGKIQAKLEKEVNNEIILQENLNKTYKFLQENYECSNIMRDLKIWEHITCTESTKEKAFQEAEIMYNISLSSCRKIYYNIEKFIKNNMVLE